jgi:hypothetical protein
MSYIDEEEGCWGCGWTNGQHPLGCPAARELEEMAARVRPEPREREICPDCRGTGLNLLDPNDGGSCPSCIGGRKMF